MTSRPFFFPDNTVLINVALIERVDLLERFVRGRGRWCASIEYEWRRSLKVLGLHEADPQVRRLCGKAIHPDHADHVDITVLHDQMRSPGDGPTKHLGEAETIVIIRRRAEFRGSVFLTDDRGAQDYALSEHAVSHCLGTADLLAYFEVAGWMSRAEAHACLETLRRERRHVRHADPAAYNGLVEGLLRRFKQKGRRR